MSLSPASLARAQAKRRKKFQEGIVISETTLMHPAASHGSSPLKIGLIELTDGSRLLAPLLSPCEIGQSVRPRMHLSTVMQTGLRVYDIAFEPLVGAAIHESPLRKNSFPGYIIAFTGPSGVGKSTVTSLVARMFSEYTAKVPILTTREVKPNDDGEYQYVSKKEFSELKKNNEIISMTHIPSESEERWYGYRASDIQEIWKQGKLPVVVTEMHLLQGLSEHYGRRSILSFGLLPPGKSKRARLSHLLHRLHQRGRETEEHIRDRMKNAEKDLAFFDERKDLFDHVLVNENLEAVIAMVKQRVPALAKA